MQKEIPNYTGYLKEEALKLSAAASFSKDSVTGELCSAGVYKWEMSSTFPHVYRSISIDTRISTEVGPILSKDVADDLLLEYIRISSLWDDSRPGQIRSRTSSDFKPEPNEKVLLEELDLSASRLGASVSSGHRHGSGELSQVSLSKGEYTGRSFPMYRTAHVAIEIRSNSAHIDNPRLTKELCTRLTEEFKTLKNLCPY